MVEYRTQVGQQSLFVLLFELYATGHMLRMFDQKTVLLLLLYVLRARLRLTYIKTKYIREPLYKY